MNDVIGTGNLFFREEMVIEETVRVICSHEVIVRTLNSNNDDKLDYAREPSMKVIAVGGNKLSRGLTLEGLLVTYFLRESGQFDTLLQMGRWFGYRKGYEDLVRIFTSEPLWCQFRELSIVELEFRESVKEMSDDPEGRTPADFAVGVRQILGLLPTAKNKLGAAVLMDNYSGRQVSVTRLTLENPTIIDQNTRFLNNLIEGIFQVNLAFTPSGNGDIPSLLARKVPIQIVRPFLDLFHIALNTDGTSLEFDKTIMLNYIDRGNQQNELNEWNVAIISVGQGTNNRPVGLQHGITVRTVNRARMKTDPVNGAYNIKAVTSKTDRKIDLGPGAVHEYDGRTKPLLLLYLIDRNSKPQDRETITRKPLYEGLPDADKRDPVSYSVIFPPNDGGRGFYRQIL